MRCRSRTRRAAGHAFPRCPSVEAVKREQKRTEGESSLGHKPDGKWKFDATVASCFDDMLERSIPDYRGMRSAVHDVGRAFLPENHRGGQLVDLGCSLGAGIEPFLKEDKYRVREFVGVEESPDMIALAQKKLARHGNRVRLIQANLVEQFPAGFSAHVVLCVLTMQFIPVEHRVTFLHRCRESLVPGGALVLVEKLTGQYAPTEKLLRSAYEAHKRQNGYSQEEIEAKRKSLAHIMTCLSSGQNEDLLRSAGFSAVEGFWRRLNFAGWFAIR